MALGITHDAAHGREVVPFHAAAKRIRHQTFRQGLHERAAETGDRLFRLAQILRPAAESAQTFPDTPHRRGHALVCVGARLGSK